jgi:hypothetical protein
MGDPLVAEYDPVDLRRHFYTSDRINSTQIGTESSGTVLFAAAHCPQYDSRGAAMAAWHMPYRDCGGFRYRTLLYDGDIT